MGMPSTSGWLAPVLLQLGLRSSCEGGGPGQEDVAFCCCLYGKFVGVPGFSQWIWQWCGLYNFTTNFRDEIRKIERSNLEPSNSKLGSWNLYLVGYFAQISCPFWTQSTLDIGYLKLRCLIKALSLTCSTSLTCYVWLLHGCLKKPQKY